MHSWRETGSTTCLQPSILWGLRLRILALPASRPTELSAWELSVTPVVIPERPVESTACETAVLESDDPIHMDTDLGVQASRINSLLP